MIINRKISVDNGKLVGIYIFFLIMTPMFLVAGIPLRMDDLVLLILITMIPVQRYYYFNYTSFLLLFLVISMVVSMFLGIVGGGSFSIGAANDVIVVLRIFILAVLIRYFIKTREELDTVLKYFYVGIGISTTIALVQYLRVEPFGSVLVSLYSHGEKYLTGYEGTLRLWRVNGTFGNPNTTAIFYAMGSVYALHKYLTASSTKKIFLHGFLTALIFFTGLITTSSRTGFVVTLSSMMFYLFLQFIGRNKIFYRPKIKFFIPSLMVIPAFFHFKLLEILPSAFRILALLEEGSVAGNLMQTTTSSRSVVWGNAINDIFANKAWIFGKGPGSSFTVDSEYLYLLYTQGLMGLIPYVLLLLFPFLTYKSVVNNEFKGIKPFFLTLFYIVAIYSVVSPVLFEAKLGPMVGIITGFWYILAKSRKYLPQVLGNREFQPAHSDK